MKKLILDYSKWRCGRDAINERNAIGQGETMLCNGDGFMCCLGQFSLQLLPDLTPHDIINSGEPFELAIKIPDLVNSSDDYYDDEYPVYGNSELSTKAMDINDDEGTTIEQKIASLTTLFKLHDYEIEVINKP